MNRVLVTLALIAAALVGVGPVASSTSPASAANSTVEPAQGGRFVPVQGRLLDTRPSNPPGTYQYSSPMPAGGWRTIQVTGKAGLPTTGMAAVVVTITVLNPDDNGRVNSSAGDIASPPTISYLNYNAGPHVSNTGVIAVSPVGTIKMALTTSEDILVDVQGYYKSGDAAEGGYRPVSAARAVDTRNGTGGVPQGLVAVGGTRTVALAGANGVPNNAQAVFANVSVVNPTGAGRIRVYAAGAPGTTTHSFTDNSTTFGLVIPLATSGSEQGKATVAFTEAGSHLVVDVVGYYSSGTNLSAFNSTQGRLYDTRTSLEPPGANGTAFAIPGGGMRTIPVSGSFGIPAGSAAVVVNMTAVTPVSDGWMRAWPTGAPEPGTTVLSYQANKIVSATATIAVGPDGTITVRNAGSGPAHLVVDVEGYFSRVTNSVPSAPVLTDPLPGGPGYATSLAPALSAQVNDSDSDALSTRFRIYNGASTVWEESVYSPPGSTTTSLQVPANKLVAGDTYTVSATTTDGLGSSPVSTSTFSVDINGVVASPTCTDTCTALSPEVFVLGTSAQTVELETGSAVDIPIPETEQLDAADYLRLAVKVRAQSSGTVTGGIVLFNPDLPTPIGYSVTNVPSSSQPFMTSTVELAPSQGTNSFRIQNRADLALALSVSIVGTRSLLDADEISEIDAEEDAAVDEPQDLEFEDDQYFPSAELTPTEEAAALQELTPPGEAAPVVSGSTTCIDSEAGPDAPTNVSRYESCVTEVPYTDWVASVEEDMAAEYALNGESSRYNDSSTALAQAKERKRECSKLDHWRVHGRKYACRSDWRHVVVFELNTQTGLKRLGKFHYYKITEVHPNLRTPLISVKTTLWWSTHTAYFDVFGVNAGLSQSCAICEHPQPGGDRKIFGPHGDWKIAWERSFRMVNAVASRPHDRTNEFFPKIHSREDFLVACYDRNGACLGVGYITTTPALRCDWLKGNPDRGCSLYKYRPTFYMSRTGRAPQVAAHILAAQAELDEHPGRPGSTPLRRFVPDDPRNNPNRQAMRPRCRDLKARGVIQGTCDEYPFASTFQGCSFKPRWCHLEGVGSRDNSVGGGILSGWYRTWRVSHGDYFYVEIR